MSRERLYSRFKNDMNLVEVGDLQHSRTFCTSCLFGTPATNLVCSTHGGNLCTDCDPGYGPVVGFVHNATLAPDTITCDTCSAGYHNTTLDATV